jgi:Na+-driven multidrug efflux pump
MSINNTSTTSSSLFLELRLWLHLAFPSALRSTADLIPWLVTLTMVGRLGTFELSSLSLTETMIYTSMVIVWNSVGKAQSTLISQAHGSKNVDAMRGFALLSFISMFCLSSLVAILWLFSDKILILAGFDNVLVKKGYEYTVWAIPSLFFNSFNITAAVYLSCMQCPGIPLLIALGSCILDTSITYIFLFILKLNLAGAAQTWSLTTLSTVFLYIIALRWAFAKGRELKYGEEEEEEEGVMLDKKESTENTISLLNNEIKSDDNIDSAVVVSYNFQDAFLYISSKQRWIMFLEQLIPNFITDLFSNSQYQAVSFMAATLGSLQIAAHNGALAILEVSLTISGGMAEATAIRVGYHLGRGDIKAAKSTVFVGVTFGTIIGLIISTIGYSLKSYLGRFFSDDPVVVSTVETLALFFWLYFFIATIDMQFLAILEGQGRASIQSGLFLIGGWGIGIPLAIASLKLTSFGLPALWASLLIGDCVVSVIGSILVFGKSDWKKLCEEASKRQD